MNISLPASRWLSSAAGPSLPSRPLLPNEPRIPDWALADALTERHLRPALADLEALFYWLRATLDPVLSRALPPVRSDKPYPQGRCLEISLAVKDRLQSADMAGMDPVAARGYRALAAFQAAGGTIRQVWGDLRGEYFQNAFLVGTLYIDSANDTVVPTKPKVEIRPFPEANFSPIRDYGHYARIAGRYWKGEVFPNHVLPALAPFCPAIVVVPGGRVTLESLSDYMLALTCRGAFRHSEVMLQAPPMDAGLLELLARALGVFHLDIPATAATGRAMALKACTTYRTEQWHINVSRSPPLLAAAVEANRRFAQLTARSAA